MTSTAEPLVFNPFDPEFRVDPYKSYRRFLAEDPVHQSMFGGWVVTRYADCVALLRDTRMSSDMRNSNMFQAFLASQNEEALELFAPASQIRPFLFLDPPDHTRLRGLVSKAFTPKVIEELRSRIQEVVDGLLDAALEKGSIEVIGDLAYPLPVQIISEMLGVPPEDHETFKGWSRELARSLDPDFGTPLEELQQRRDAALAFADYFRSLIAERRDAPRDDLLSALVAVEERGDTLTEEELLATLTLLLVAGHETTVNLIGNGTLALLRNPDQRRRLRDDPSLAKNAVEEVLRYDPPVQMTVRNALEQVEVAGVTVEKGQETVILLGAANRDPEQFSDPERFDVARPDANRHLAFSSGHHFCLGAPLARLEGQIALNTLVQRAGERQLDLQLVNDAPDYKENIVLRGLAALPISW